MKYIRHIFFDLDHTLWDFEKNSALTFQQLLEAESFPVSITDFLKVYQPINFEYWKRYREEKVTKEALKYGRLKDTFTALGLSVTDEKINQMAEEYLKILPQYNHLFDGAIALLEYLKNKYELHIITNGFEEVQLLKMEKSGVLQYFNQIITSEAVGVKKPDPKVFEFSLQKASASKKESIMIGDNLEADIMGAINFGIEAIYCNFEGEKVPINIKTVSSLLEIKEYL